MKMVERIPDVLAGAMGNQMYLAIFPTQAEMDQFYYDVHLCFLTKCLFQVIYIVLQDSA